MQGLLANDQVVQRCRSSCFIFYYVRDKTIDLLVEYSTTERVLSPTFFKMVPFEVPHHCGPALFKVGMYF
jgi:hypothetical protein